jgi:oxygen-independent coproporphyrinogen III oxidase
MASLYLHIPFCERKCIYCDFYSIENVSPMEEFLDALDREMLMYAHLGRGVRFETIFFGGGTPSLLTPVQMERILDRLRSSYRVEPDAEITVETNPGTVDGQKLRAYRTLGINRLSIGIQSFHDDELTFLGRIHDSGEAIRCVEDAGRAGFDNINIDLIYSLPGQTMERWRRNLEHAVALGPHHMSAYSLIVEDRTPLARMVAARQVSPNPTDTEADLYDLTMEFLESAGFEHYEVSNYALPGFRSRHNANYWNHSDYLSFGPSAHSFWSRHKQGQSVPRRWWNVANVSHYCTSLRKNELPVASSEVLTSDQLRTERIFLGLRSDGLDLHRLEDDFGVTFSPAHAALIQQLVEERHLVAEGGGRLRLSPKGYVLCDEICERLVF